MSQPCTPPEQIGADDPRAAALAEGRPFVRGGGAGGTPAPFPASAGVAVGHVLPMTSFVQLRRRRPSCAR
ncbi:hypothetical protein [Streptomyces sp. NPDC005859]|uniref:hypothetical protein n=1 Tax=Streptomyces sp. NPDC005859 TaxID=3157170 RepID=UPI003405CDE2